MTLQATGIKLVLDKDNEYYLFNLYNQPSKRHNVTEMRKILTNYKQKTIIVGDLNGHNPIWDMKCPVSDGCGNAIERIVDNSNLCILNDPDCSTYYSKAQGKFSSIDLTLCTDDLTHELEWHVSEDDFSSDHFPIIISCPTPDESEPDLRFNTNKANWAKYQKETEKIEDFNPENNHNEMADKFEKSIIEAASKSIPKVNPNGRRKTVPWWNNELKELVKAKHKLKNIMNKLNNKYENLRKRSNYTDNIDKMIETAIEIYQLKPLYNKTCAKFKNKSAIMKQET